VRVGVINDCFEAGVVREYENSEMSNIRTCGCWSCVRYEIINCSFLVLKFVSEVKECSGVLRCTWWSSWLMRSCVARSRV
jgi:phage-related tail fiber protein